MLLPTRVSIPQAYKLLSDSDLYLALFAEDSAVFRAEWSIAETLKIPRFAVRIGATPMVAGVRHVANPDQALAALASDLFHYMNRGLSPRYETAIETIEANPGLLCIIVASLPPAKLRRLACALNEPHCPSRRHVCRTLFGDPSPHRIALIRSRLQTSFPGMFDDLPEAFDSAPSFRLVELSDAQAESDDWPLNVVKQQKPDPPPAKQAAEADKLPGELGTYQAFIQWLRNGFKSNPLFTLSLLGIAITLWLLVPPVAETIRNSVKSRADKFGEATYFAGAWPQQKLDSNWAVWKGPGWTYQNWDKRTLLAIKDSVPVLKVSAHSLGVANLKGSRLGTYGAFFRVALTPDMTSLTWILRGANENLYLATELSFRSEPGKFHAQAYKFRNKQREVVLDNPNLVFAPIESGDYLEVNIENVTQTAVTQTVKVNRFSDADKKDFSGRPVNLEFRFNDSKFAEGLFGFASNEEFIVYDLRLEGK